MKKRDSEIFPFLSKVMGDQELIHSDPISYPTKTVGLHFLRNIHRYFEKSAI